MSADEAQAYGRERHFSAPTLERWLALTPADRDALLEIANQLRLGENHFRDIFDLVEAIAVRQQTTFGAVLASQSVSAARQAGRGRNETLKRLKDVLRRHRYPQLAAAEAALLALVKALSLPPEVRIEFPENLEGKAIVVTVRAQSAAELQSHAQALTAACRRAEMDEIFNRLEGDS